MGTHKDPTGLGRGTVRNKRAQKASKTSKSSPQKTQMQNRKTPRPKAKKRIKPHPLRARRRPGPASADAPLPAEQDLAHAARVLELVDRGILAAGSDVRNEDTVVPLDRVGRPTRRLEVEDERELARRIQGWGDIDARNILVMANLGLVHLVANQFRRPTTRYEDLVQEGTLGLLRATETFEPDRGVRFSTYSVYWIRAKIQRYLQRQDRDDVPSIAGAGMVEDENGRRRRPRAGKLSLERPVDDEDGRTLGDSIAAGTDNPEEVAARNQESERVKAVLQDIAGELEDPRMATIIRRRLLAEEPETLATLGHRLKLSREGARLLETKLLRMARERLAAMRESA
jgi:RNA polymerase sigma factor (sigma-70 family)